MQKSLVLLLFISWYSMASDFEMPFAVDCCYKFFYQDRLNELGSADKIKVINRCNQYVRDRLESCVDYTCYQDMCNEYSAFGYSNLAVGCRAEQLDAAKERLPQRSDVEQVPLHEEVPPSLGEMPIAGDKCYGPSYRQRLDELSGAQQVTAVRKCNEFVRRRLESCQDFACYQAICDEYKHNGFADLAAGCKAEQLTLAQKVLPQQPRGPERAVEGEVPAQVREYMQDRTGVAEGGASVEEFCAQESDPRRKEECINRFVGEKRPCGSEDCRVIYSGDGEKESSAGGQATGDSGSQVRPH